MRARSDGGGGAVIRKKPSGLILRLVSTGNHGASRLERDAHKSADSRKTDVAVFRVRWVRSQAGLGSLDPATYEGVKSCNSSPILLQLEANAYVSVE